MISAVIASIGGPELAATLAALQRGTLAPDEILVCLPAGFEDRAAAFATDSITVRICSCRGQVAQRAEGFRAVRGDLVLQLDDDLTLDANCLENLAAALNGLPQRSTVAPTMLDRNTHSSVYSRPQSTLRRLFFRLMNGANGYDPGRVAKSGFGMGIDATGQSGRVIPVEWLPGGCALHRRENLFLDAFFPFPGKAFCEDLMHSAELVSKGISLFIVSDSKCYLDDREELPPGFFDLLKNLRADLRARWFYLNRYAKPSPRILVYAAVRLVHLLRKACSTQGAAPDH